MKKRLFLFFLKLEESILFLFLSLIHCKFSNKPSSTGTSYHWNIYGYSAGQAKCYGKASVL
jgi:hypothetical protein